MKKIIRWFSGLLLAVLLLMAAGTGIAWFYKPELTAAIHEKLRENINGEFNIDNISVSVIKDFPQVSVTLEGIYLRGIRYDRYKKDFLRAKKVLVNVHLGKLFLKQIDVKSIRIEEAEVFIFRTKSGYANTDIFKRQPGGASDSSKTGNPALLNIHTIFFENVAIAWQDSLKGKSIGFKFVNGRNDVVQTDSSRQFHYKGRIDFDRLQFNEKKGGFLTGKQAEAVLDGEFVAERHQLKVNPSSLRLAESQINLSGGFHFVPDGKFRLAIASTDMHYDEGLSVLPQALREKLTRYSISTPFAISVDVDGNLSPGNDPVIGIQFETKDAEVTIEKHKALHVSTKGSFTNRRDPRKAINDINSSIVISGFEGVVYGLPVKADAAFNNLTDPDADLKVTVDADSKMLQHEIDTAIFHINRGSVVATVSYAGKLNDLIEPSRHITKDKLIGTAELKNIQLVWVPRKLLLDNMNGAVKFSQQQFQLTKLDFVVNKSKVMVSGNMDGFSTLFTQMNAKSFVKLQVQSPSLNLTAIFPENQKPRAVTQGVKTNKVISDVIDKMYKRLEFELTLDIQNLQSQRFAGSHLRGSLSLKDNVLSTTSLRMTTAGGDVALRFRLSDLNKPLNPLFIQADLRQADIRQFFYEFNNFKQRTIDASNLSGKISASVTLNAMLDDDFNVMMPTLEGNVDATVKDGKLSNFSPLQKMSSFLFKNRDFSDIDFAEIKSTFDLRATELSISRMEVESSVLTMFIEGRFSLADSTDLSIQLPLSNLKRRDKDYTPKNVGTDSKVGPSVFLRARPDQKGAMSIAYDPFKKFRKK